MTSNVIVDSCVAAKWVLPEWDSGKADALVTDAAAQGFRLVLLDIAFPEIANAIWKRHHRKLVSRDEALQYFGDLLAINVVVEPVTPLLTRSLEIALQYDRAYYDAAFVALTEHLSLPGVTADEPLYQAVKADFPNIKLLRDW